MASAAAQSCACPRQRSAYDARMGEDLASLNRPVHLARRDACIERAAELLNAPMDQVSSQQYLGRISFVIQLVREAVIHAKLAGRAGASREREKDFFHFLGLLLRNVESAHGFLASEVHLESEEHSFLARYLGTSADEADLSALNYRRWAQDIILGLQHMMRMALGPFRQLQEEDQHHLPVSDRERYALSVESFRNDVLRRFPL